MLKYMLLPLVMTFGVMAIGAVIASCVSINVVVQSDEAENDAQTGIDRDARIDTEIDPEGDLNEE